MRETEAHEKKVINDHVNRLVNASVVRLMQKMVNDFKEEERINRLTARWLIPPLVVISVVSIGYLIFSTPGDLKNSVSRNNNMQVAELPQPILAQEDQSKPQKVLIAPGSLVKEHAAYYASVIQRLGAVGNAHLANHDKKTSHGEAIVAIPINTDGTLNLKDGGAKIEKSSGNPRMDELALILIEKAAPYPNFKATARNADEIRVIYTRMKIESGENEKSGK